MKNLLLISFISIFFTLIHGCEDGFDNVIQVYDELEGKLTTFPVKIFLIYSFAFDFISVDNTFRERRRCPLQKCKSL